MNISYDGVTVSFETESEELFLAEKSGTKSNTVRIIDQDERQQLKKELPEKIIIQHEQEIILRTLTHVYVSEMVLEKNIAIFSWTNEKHHHQTLDENDYNPYAHNLCLDKQELPIDLTHTTILIPRTLVADLNLQRRMTPIPEFISNLLEEYRTKRAEERGPLHD